MSSAQTIERVLVWVRRTLAVVFGVPITIGIGMSLVDSYRRRGKKPKPFPTTPPNVVEVGEGTITTYTFGKDLYADMLSAIEGAQRQVLFETYIWKGDAVGEQFKAALAAAADRGVEVYCIYDGFANLVVSPRFKRFPPSMKVLRYPAYSAGWRFFDLRRYGRDHRKILVVDDKEAYVGGYNIGSAYETEWRDTHVRITGPGVQDLRRAFADFWNLHRRRRLRASERPLLVETASVWEPQIRLQRNVPRLWMFPIRGMYLEAINRASTNVWMTSAYFIPDQIFVDALRSAARPRRGRPAPGAAQVQPHRRGLALPRVLLPAARGRRPDLPVQGRDGAREDVDRGRLVVDGRHGEHRPAEPPGQLRDQRRGHRPRTGQGPRGHLGGRRVELHRADPR